MANRLRDTQMEASHLPGQGLQRKAQRNAQKKHVPDIAGRKLGGKRVSKRRAASARRR